MVSDWIQRTQELIKLEPRYAMVRIDGTIALFGTYATPLSVAYKSIDCTYQGMLFGLKWLNVGTSRGAIWGKAVIWQLNILLSASIGTDANILCLENRANLVTSVCSVR